jgi:hypothetical protein
MGKREKAQPWSAIKMGSSNKRYAIHDSYTLHKSMISGIVRFQILDELSEPGHSRKFF